jgi:hypothetical protein
MIPTACEGKNLWKGNKNPVALVATVVQMKTAVQPLRALEVNKPSITTNPATMPIKLSRTWINVNGVIEVSFVKDKGSRYHTRAQLWVQLKLQTTT